MHGKNYLVEAFLISTCSERFHGEMRNTISDESLDIALSILVIPSSRTTCVLAKNVSGGGGLLKME